jgi:intein/homing endonuclease
MKRIPSNFRNEILKLLEQGCKPTQIANTLNLNKVSVNSFCKNLGYSFKISQGNVKYFENIDTHQKAYFLGFIAADGAIVNNTLTITIHKKDIELLEKLKSEIGNLHNIQSINTKMSFDSTRRVNHVRYTLTNKDLISDLNNLGIFPKKSLTISNIIQNIPYEFRDSFIIGYFDGDGCIVFPPPSKKQTSVGLKTYPTHRMIVSLRGTKEFLNGIADHLEINYKIYFHKTHILCIRKKEYILRFFNCYKNLNFYLKRKHDKFLEKINHESFKRLI